MPADGARRVEGPSSVPFSTGGLNFLEDRMALSAIS